MRGGGAGTNWQEKIFFTETADTKKEFYIDYICLSLKI